MTAVRSLGRAKTASSLALGLLCIVAMSGARAAATFLEEGSYYGLGLGQSSFDLNKSDLDNTIEEVFTPPGVTVQSFSSELDDSDTTYDALVGYRFGAHLAVEGAYADLGAAAYTASMTLTDGVNTADVTISEHFSFKGFTVSVLGIERFGERWEAFGRGGLIYADTKLSISGVFNTAPFTGDDSTHSTDWVLGVGVGCELGDHFSIRLEYQKFKNLGDSNTGEADVDTFDLRVLYRL
jgi:opacity protein-like surface antigen